jgi:hypothetical protein
MEPIRDTLAVTELGILTASPLKKFANALSRILLFTLLITFYDRVKNPPPKQPSINAVGSSSSVDDLDINRHKEDGFQSDLQSAYPGQKPTISWEIN